MVASDHAWYRLIDDDEWIDDIHIHVTPRFKTSELSGDEWRVSAAVDFSRKGRIVKTERYSDIGGALAYIAKYAWRGGLFPGNLDVLGDVTTDLVENYCMQPGCSELWTVEYNMVHQGCSHCGNVTEINQDWTQHHRRFCDAHKTRGDSSLDDSDRVYVPLGAPAEVEGTPSTGGDVTEAVNEHFAYDLDKAMRDSVREAGE